MLNKTKTHQTVLEIGFDVVLDLHYLVLETGTGFGIGLHNHLKIKKTKLDTATTANLECVHGPISNCDMYSLKKESKDSTYQIVLGIDFDFAPASAFCLKKKSMHVYYFVAKT